MVTKPYHNSTNKTVHIGNKSIRPGETREVDETMCPDFKANKPKAAAADPNAKLLLLLDLSVPKLVEALHGKTMEELDILEEAEEAGKTRVGAIAAITEARLIQVAADEHDEHNFAYQAKLIDLTDEELETEFKTQEDDDLLPLIQAEMERRIASKKDAE